MKIKIILIIAIQFWIIVSSLSADAVMAKVTKVISGDTFLTDDGDSRPCKFYYFKAPSMKTKKGQMAKAELERLILNKEIRAVVADESKSHVFIYNLFLYPIDLRVEGVENVLIKKKILYQYRKFENQGY